MTTMATSLQDRLIAEAVGSIEAGRDALLYAPTGAGKSRKFSLIAEDQVRKNRRVIVMAGRQKLVRQGARAMDRWSRHPVETSIGMDGHIDHSGQVVYTTVQTAHDHRDNLPRYDVAIIDEAHHAKRDNPEYTETMDALVRANPGIRFVAVTATPPEEYAGLHPRLVAADKHIMTFEEAIEARLIDLPETITPALVMKDHRSVREVVDSHRRGSTSATMEAGISREISRITPEDWHHQVANLYERTLAGRRVLAFYDTIKEANGFADEVRARGMPVEIIDSRRSLAANERSMESFQQGKSPLLVSVDMISEGVDLDADGILLAKRTTSAQEYKQIIGRESRSHGTTRERKALLVDIGASTYMHGDIAAQAQMQTLRGGIERNTLGPDDLLPGATTSGFRPWVEMRSESTGRSVAGTSVDGAIVYAAPNGDRYAVFRSVEDRKGQRFEMMQIGEDRKGMTSGAALGQWICEAVRRNERQLSQLVGNRRDGASHLMRMVERDWQRHQDTIDKTLSLLGTHAIAAQQAGRQIAAAL